MVTNNVHMFLFRHNKSLQKRSCLKRKLVFSKYLHLKLTIFIHIFRYSLPNSPFSTTNDKNDKNPLIIAFKLKAFY